MRRKNCKSSLVGGIIKTLKFVRDICTKFICYLGLPESMQATEKSMKSFI